MNFDGMKVGDVMREAMKVQTREEGQRFLSDYSQVVVSYQVKEHGLDLTSKEATEVAKDNLGLMALMYGEDTVKHFQQVFDIGVPNHLEERKTG